MAAPVFEKSYIQDIRQDVRVRHCGGLMFTGDALADTISVRMYDGESAYPISGSVACNCIRADGATVPVEGTVSGNTAQATLTQACCAVQGPLTVVMKVTSGSVTTTILKAIYTVDVGETGTIVDPGTIIPDVAALIAAIEAAIGSIPADYSALLATIAPTFSSSTTYYAGDYVWHGGTLYRFTADHAAGSWVGTDATAAVVMDEINAVRKDSDEGLAELKSAVDQFDSIIYPNEPILVKSEIGYALDASFKNFNTSTLLSGHKYRFTIKFSVYPQTLAAISTATGTGGSSVVDNITSLFVGDSWTEGKTAEYTPQVSGITYLRIAFNSSYQGTYTADIYVYDITDVSKTEFDNINNEINETNNNVAGLYELQDAVNVLKPYNLLPPDGYTVNKSVDRGTGELVDSTGKVASDYIEIDPTQGYICNNTKTSSITFDPTTGTADSGNIMTFDRFAYAFYDKDKAYIPYVSGADATSKAIPQNAKYIRVTVVSEEDYPIARLIYGNYQAAPIVRIVQYKKVPPKYYDKPSTGFENFKMVMFGDSITHGSLSVSNDGTSYVDYANDYLNSNIMNVGFGATRATYTLSGAGLFCFYHLCECIVSSNANAWDDLVSYAENENVTYLPHLQKLMAVDWSKVNAIGLMYGANDFTSNTPVGSAYNETVTNYDGAIAYGIKLLVEKYPHLQVLILAPFDRMMDATDPETMTDTTPNTAGLYMYDYADSLIHVAKHFHCPRINTNDLFQMDQYRILLYASDGTHPRSNIAQFRLGWLFAQTVKRYLSPV